MDVIKECYFEGLHAFIARCEKEEAVLAPGTTLSQLKLDGRKRIEITDQEGEKINIKASKAKELFPEMEEARLCGLTPNRLGGQSLATVE